MHSILSVASIIAGVLIILRPQFLSYIVAAILIIMGILGLTQGLYLPFVNRI